MLIDHVRFIIHHLNFQGCWLADLLAKNIFAWIALPVKVFRGKGQSILYQEIKFYKNSPPDRSWAREAKGFQINLLFCKVFIDGHSNLERSFQNQDAKHWTHEQFRNSLTYIAKLCFGWTRNTWERQLLTAQRISGVVDKLIIMTKGVVYSEIQEAESHEGEKDPTRRAERIRWLKPIILGFFPHSSIPWIH